MSYIEDRYKLILELEEGGDVKLKPYNDGKGNITIGAGFNIMRSNEGLSDLTLEELSIKVDFYTDDAQIVNQIYLDKIKNYLKGPFFVVTENTAVQRQLLADDTVKIQRELDEIMKSRSEAMAAVDVSGLPQEFTFPDADSVENFFNNKVAESYETEYQKYINDLDITGGRVPLSITDNEHLVLFSLAYNSPSDPSKKLLGPGLKWAIENANRAEAWFQIRYLSNGDNLGGIAKRRYAESEIFGIYEDPSNPTDKELKDFYRTLWKQGAKISEYELKYHGNIANANSALHDAGHADLNVNKIAVEKDLARVELESRFGEGQSIEKILVGYDTIYDNSLASERGKHGINDSINGNENYNDLIFGERGNDVINGLGGHDVLYGGKGTDYLSGGSGNDTYVFNKGDGKDTIYDTDGLDKLVFGDGVNINDLVFKADGLDLQIGLKQGLVTDINLVDDVVTIKDYYFSSFSGFEVGGVFYGRNDAFGQRLETLGNDIINYSNADEVIRAAAGNDYVSLGGGSDTYIYNIDDGTDILGRNSVGGLSLPYDLRSEGSLSVSTTPDNGDNTTLEDGSFAKDGDEALAQYVSDADGVSFVMNNKSYINLQKKVA